MIQIKSGAPAEHYYRQRRAARDSHAYAISGVKRRIATTVVTRLRADRDHAALDALIADLARRSDQWANRIAASPPSTARRGGRRPSATPTFASTALTGELARINDPWEAALCGCLSP
jgi:hypothetical protein